MRTMQELKPEVSKIRSKYKDDRQKQQEAMIDLYRERRVNPLAGFLPILVQVPVFITMYQVVRSHEETFPSFASGGLLWFTDLTRADPYFVLPVLSASLLVAAGEVSARKVDPQHRRLMRFMAVAFTALIARFPAGLFVYWVTSNAVTLAQNLLVYRRVVVEPLPPGPGKTKAGSAQDSVVNSSADGSDPAESLPSPRTKQAEGARKKRNKRKR
jgi:YidC/Oxa1 family membrane protein insertase